MALALTLTLTCNLTRRAPYLFGGPPVSSVAEAEAAWQAAKATERAAVAAVAVAAVAPPEVPRGDGRTRRSPSPTMRLHGDGRRMTRRAVAAEASAVAAVAAAAAALCRPALALPPPCGSSESLVPLLQCRVLLAELAALAMAGGTIDLGPSPNPHPHPHPHPHPNPSP